MPSAALREGQEFLAFINFRLRRTFGSAPHPCRGAIAVATVVAPAAVVAVTAARQQVAPSAAGETIFL